ncbi:MAG: HAMP domain-containing sensor histidine kinase [Candidatus Sumerlaeia bacterium]|nr:HAMP domain-containing sensor histidine kinase [Candidatus Sumerlaeia bacterium]
MPGATARGRPLWRRVQRNLLLGAATLLFAAAALAAAILIDRLGFERDKRAVMAAAYESGEAFSLAQRDSLSKTADQFLRRVQVLSVLETPEQLGALCDQILADNPALFRISFELEGTVLFERSDTSRIARNNDLSNSLLLRDFRFTITQLAGNQADSRRGLLRVELTALPREAMSPDTRAAMDAQVSAWRLRLLGALGGLLTVYLALLFGVVLPVRRVVGTLGEDSGGGAALLPETRSLLEEVYNNLARDAALARLAAELRESAGADANADVVAFLAQVPALVSRRAGLAGARAMTLRRAPRVGATWHLVSAAEDPESSLAPSDAFTPVLLAELQALDGAPLPASFPVVFTDRDGKVRRTVALPVSQEEDVAHLLLFHLPAGAAEPRPWWRDYMERVAREVRVAAQGLDTRRRLILQEKSKANVSLSRNLGHDLTNIIATAKLELMAVRTFLAMSPEDIASAPAKQAIFREALQSLLDTTRFMQEVVNLYRSFAYLSRPKFEEAKLADLCAEAAALFRVSSSALATVEASAEEGLAPLRIEPRLFKLALFNLMANALDAVKRGAGAEAASKAWRIELRAEADPSTGGQRVLVRDNGPGIRSADGRLLSPDEIAGIFRLGYSTKGEGEGEGLGLNWVQTIVSEFHGGRITARNREEGGAEFVLHLPPEPGPQDAPEGD